MSIWSIRREAGVSCAKKWGNHGEYLPCAIGNEQFTCMRRGWHLPASNSRQEQAIESHFQNEVSIIKHNLQIMSLVSPVWSCMCSIFNSADNFPRPPKILYVFPDFTAEIVWDVLVINESSTCSIISSAVKDLTDGTCCYVLDICNNHI